MFRLDRKNAIVTGAGSGIGRAIATLFAAQGARIFIFERATSAGAETADAIRASGGATSVIDCDVASAASVRAAFERFDTEAPRLDILINNAGIAHVGTVENTAEADFDRIYSVNVKGVFLCSQQGVPRMLTAGGGAIVNL